MKWTFLGLSPSCHPAISAAESREALEHALQVIAATLGDPDPMLWQTV
ncbi:hypothetical protein [Salinicola acroporae]|nr:hypothetical protein [Salinicola acroporae]